MAVALADELLHYRNTHGFTVQLAAENILTDMRAIGVTPYRVLEKALAFELMYSYRPERFPTQRAVETGTARAVLHLLPRSVTRSARLYRFLGELIRNSLGTYCAMLVKRIEEDAAKRSGMIKASCDFDTVVEPAKGIAQ